MGHPCPRELTLELRPSTRFDVIDVASELDPDTRADLARFPQVAYFSHHTTAGYLEQRLAERLGNDPERVRAFLENFRRLFPAKAGYEHDQLDRRTELTDLQRESEPLNGDSHLTFISSGLTSCATYRNRSEVPVYFVDLDGTNGADRRSRRTTLIGFHDSRRVVRLSLPVPTSDHSIDSINLRDPRLGILEQIQELLDRYGVSKGRVDLRLADGEQHAGLTVNEYETLLMQYDLASVLRDPVRFMAERGRSALRDPRGLPSRAKDYAKYDLVQLVNQALDAFGLQSSVAERLIHKFLSVPASRFLRMKRSVSLLVSDGSVTDETGGRLLAGQYQSPILVQWRSAPGHTRHLEATVHDFL